MLTGQTTPHLGGMQAVRATTLKTHRSELRPRVVRHVR